MRTRCDRWLRCGLAPAFVMLGLACGTGGGVDPGTDAATDAIPETGADAPLETADDGAFDVIGDVAPDIPLDVSIPPVLGGARPAALYVPDDYDPARAWPLVLLLHGYGTSGFMVAAHFGAVERVTSQGFVLLAPEGSLDADGKQFWNASASCCDFDGSGVDDVGYLRSLIGEARQVLNIDAGRVYLLGYSNGAFLAQRMACDASDVVTGIGALAGSIATGFACTPARPVSILSIHGTADDTIPFAGGAFMGLAEFVGADALVGGWKVRNGCSQPAAPAAAPRDCDITVDGAETTNSGWSGCDRGTRVDLWTLAGSGHAPLFTEDCKDAILDHLLSMGRTGEP